MAPERYELHDHLGEGAASLVYRARDRVLGRWAAVKVLKAPFCRQNDFLTRFYAEARAAARIVHPNVVVVFDVCERTGRPMIVMELVEGGSLADRLRLLGTVREEKAISYAAQIARALAAAHEQNVVHRDVKPSNVLIGADDSIKVVDFGIAKALDADTTTVTQSGTFLGSVHYLSPEQAQGGRVTPSSDLYSLGIVLYQMRFGAVPFESESPLATALAHVERPVPTRAHLEREMSPGLAFIVERLLAKRAEDRFESADALASALDALQKPAEHTSSAALEAPTIVKAPIPPPKRRVRRLHVRLPFRFPALGAYWTRAQKRWAPRLPPIATVARAHPREFAAAAALLLLSFVPLLVPHPARLAAASAAVRTAPPHRAAPRAPSALHMPNLDNMPVSHAGALVFHMGLRAQIRAMYSDAPLFTVIGQYPRPGTMLHKGGQVIMIVSGGVPPPE